MALRIGKKTGLKYFDINDVRSWNPCYDPIKHLKENTRYTVLDILNNDNISTADKLWVVMRTDLVSEKCMRLFAVWCARQAVKPDADKRTLDVLDVAERFAQGHATLEDLATARSAAESAAWSAARSAAWSAAESAAESAAWSAAWSAARSATAAARSAIAAAWSAAWSAARSATAAAWSAAESAQIKKITEMILIEGQERILKRNKK